MRLKWSSSQFEVNPIILWGSQTIEIHIIHNTGRHTWLNAGSQTTRGRRRISWPSSIDSSQYGRVPTVRPKRTKKNRPRDNNRQQRFICQASNIIQDTHSGGIIYTLRNKLQKASVKKFWYWRALFVKSLIACCWANLLTDWSPTEIKSDCIRSDHCIIAIACTAIVPHCYIAHHVTSFHFRSFEEDGALW